MANCSLAAASIEGRREVSSTSASVETPARQAIQASSPLVPGTPVPYLVRGTISRLGDRNSNARTREEGLNKRTLRREESRCASAAGHRLSRTASLICVLLATTYHTNPTSADGLRGVLI